MERGAKSSKVKVESKLPVTMKSRNEGPTERAFEKRLAETLEQQAAISEILRVIARSPGDVKPMLNAVAERALKLCDAADATISGRGRPASSRGALRQLPNSPPGRAIHAADSRLRHGSRRHRRRGDPHRGPG